MCYVALGVFFYLRRGDGNTQIILVCIYPLGMLVSMRPLILRLEGFQGFLEPETIDLTNIHSAAITGPVGAGKSSILDAITYALYGEVRSPTVDGVIHTHAKAMSVEMDFALGEGTYRVKRTRTRKSAKTFLWRLGEGDPEPIGDGDGRTSATEAVLFEMYPVSYQTFRASVLVEQGKSDSFIEATPSARHAMLGEILGLGRFADLHKKARAQLTEKKNEVARLDTLLEGSEEAEQAAAEAEQAAEAASLEATRQAEACTQAQKELTESEQAATDAQEALNRVLESNAADATRLTEAQAAHATASQAAQTAQAQVQATRLRVSDVAGYIADKQTQVTEQAAQLTETESALSNEYAQKYEGADTRLTNLQAQANQAQAQVAEAASWVAQVQEELRQATAAASELGAQVQRLSHERDSLATQWKDEHSRLTQYQGHSSVCHTCGQQVDDVMTGRIIADLQNRLSALTGQGQHVKASLDQAQAQEQQAQRAVESAHRRMAEAQAAQAAAQSEAATIAVHLEAANTLLAEAESAREALERVRGELALFESGQHPTQAALAQAQAQHNELAAAAQAQEQEQAQAQAQLAEAERTLERVRAETTLQDTTPLEQAAVNAQERHLKAQTAAQAAELARVRAEAHQAHTQQAAETAQQQVQQFTQHTKDRKAARAEQTVLENTVKAFAPTGIPQMMMNAALETMNLYLHQYLQDISGNVLTAELTTTLEKKDGGTKNELNILVTGADGNPRPYETFSGGQRFLTDFALHLTNAKILADKQGAVVDFCAVDEGWNSLEGEEKTAVLRAVQNLSDTYSLVLTITHDEDVVNSMPQQIAVEQVSGTSVVKVRP